MTLIPVLPPKLAVLVDAELSTREGREASYELQAFRTSVKIANGAAVLPEPSYSFSSRLTVKVRELEPSPMKIWDFQKKNLILEADAGRSAKICFQNMKSIDCLYRSVFRSRPVSASSTHLMNVHLRCPYVHNNAFWSLRDKSIFIGDFTSDIFSPWDQNPDVLAHLFGYAVTQFAPKLEYQGQSGALTESFSDVMAILHKHRKAGVDANSPEANWLIADGLIVNDDGRGALRSMDEGPGFHHSVLGIDDQPKHMNNYLKTKEDHGGVHANSGIPNHAFYLAARAIGGPSWEIAGSIWYLAHTASRADSYCTFSAFANRTIEFAKEHYGEEISGAVADAWRHVGVELHGVRQMCQQIVIRSDVNWRWYRNFLLGAFAASAGIYAANTSLLHKNEEG